MALVERPLAGPGWPGTALGVLDRAGWVTTNDEKANAYASSPDHRVLVAFLPEDNELATDGTLWLIRAFNDLHQVVWEATFTEEVPAEFIAAFLADLVKGERLDPDREDDDAPVPAPAGVG